MRLRDKQKVGTLVSVPGGKKWTKSGHAQGAGKFRASRCLAKRFPSSSLRSVSPEHLAIIEREREILGQDLHDGLCQFLTALRIRVDLLERHLQKRVPAEARLVQPVLHLLDQAVEKMRALVYGVQPVEPVPAGLMMALRQLTASARELFGVPVRCRLPRPVRIANPAVALNLFYIAQEAVNNAVKHARPRKIYVSLTRRPRWVVLTVANGGGPFADAGRTRGLGLKTMRFRAERIGGILEIQPRRQGGTVLTCAVPVANTKASFLT